MHARSIAAAGIDDVTGELFRAKLSPSHEQVLSWLTGLPGPVAVAYEAGPTGFGLYRVLTEAGISCVVAAPSKIARPSGDRVKTDARDAMLLARLLRLNDLTPVAVPSPEQEAARDLVRAREDARGDLMRARHRLSKLLLRHGIVYSGGSPWTGRHDRWLRTEVRPRFAPGLGVVTFDSDYDAVLTVTARRDRLDKQIAITAADCPYTPLVRRLGCLRGISVHTAREDHSSRTTRPASDRALARAFSSSRRVPARVVTNWVVLAAFLPSMTSRARFSATCRPANPAEMTKLRFDARARRLNGLFSGSGPIDEVGALAVSLQGSVCVETYPFLSRERESWRVFRKGAGDHLVFPAEQRRQE
nr:transposase [Myceligenerans indicum]